MIAKKFNVKHVYMFNAHIRTALSKKESEIALPGTRMFAGEGRGKNPYQ